MSKRTDSEFLRDIEEAINRISAYTRGITYEEFLRDTKTQDAVVRNVEIIGEAVKNLSEELRQRRADIPWKNMAGARDRLIHGYFGVSFDIVWEIVSNELPLLRESLKKLLNEQSSQ
jgi:uncharacterized protein with HEPN domain